MAPSNPNIIYVGSGAGIIRPDLAVGDGIYKSNDAGKTWKFVAPFPDFGKSFRPDWTPSKQWAAGWRFCAATATPLPSIR